MSANKVPLIDTHCDVVIPYQELKDSFGIAVKNTQTSLPLLRKANVRLIFAGFSYDDLLKDSYNQLDNLHQMINKYSNDFELIQDFKQVRNLWKSNKIGIIITIEGAAILEGNMNTLLDLYKRGVRSLGFTHNTKNSLGTGALVDDKTGLTDFGKEVIKKCNELNIILDLSHLNETGFYEVIKLSKKMPYVSHGNSYTITKNPRNFNDKQLKELAKIGSYIGIFFSGRFVKSDSNEGQPTIEDAIEHIEHIVSIAGIDHVGLGCDFGGITTGLPKGLENHSKVVDLFKKLTERGFSEEDIEKLAYKNALRVINSYK